MVKKCAIIYKQIEARRMHKCHFKRTTISIMHKRHQIIYSPTPNFGCNEKLRLSLSRGILVCRRRWLSVPVMNYFEGWSTEEEDVNEGYWVSQSKGYFWESRVKPIGIFAFHTRPDFIFYDMTYKHSAIV